MTYYVSSRHKTLLTHSLNLICIICPVIKLNHIDPLDPLLIILHRLIRIT